MSLVFLELLDFMELFGYYLQKLVTILLVLEVEVFFLFQVENEFLERLDYLEFLGVARNRQNQLETEVVEDLQVDGQLEVLLVLQEVLYEVGAGGKGLDHGIGEAGVSEVLQSGVYFDEFDSVRQVVFLAVEVQTRLLSLSLRFLSLLVLSPPLHFLTFLQLHPYLVFLLVNKKQTE